MWFHMWLSLVGMPAGVKLQSRSASANPVTCVSQVGASVNGPANDVFGRLPAGADNYTGGW